MCQAKKNYNYPLFSPVSLLLAAKFKKIDRRRREKWFLDLTTQELNRKLSSNNAIVDPERTTTKVARL